MDWQTKKNYTLVIGSHHALDLRNKSGEMDTTSWVLEMQQSVEMVLVTQQQDRWFGFSTKSEAFLSCRIQDIQGIILKTNICMPIISKVIEIEQYVLWVWLMTFIFDFILEVL